MADAEQHKSGALLAYILYFVGLVFPLASIAAVIVNHLKRGDSKGTWVESHHRWMMRTFWFSLIWGVVAGILFVVPPIGLLLGFALVIWYLYRIIRGALAYKDEKPMYAKTAPIEEQIAGEQAG